MNNYIQVKRYVTHNCIENCIANLCDYYKTDFRPLFLFSWDFGFKTTEPILENKIHSHSEFDISIDEFYYTYYEISKLYLNISFIPVSKDIVDIMSSLINGDILLIRSDAFCIPWNLAFNRYHIPHYFLLTYNHVKKLINVTDSFCSNNIIELECLEDITIESCLSVCFLKNNQNKDMPALQRNRYITILKSNANNGVYNSIVDFSNELNRIESIEQLTENLDDLSNAILIRRLSNIANERYNTKCLFEYFEWPNKFVDAMDDIYTKWESVRNIFLKIILSKRIKLLSKISEELHIIANTENNLINMIIEENTL